MEIRKAHLFFEQSGTFKKAFKNLGIDAEDYDILNEFGETDHIIDLFEEIERAFDGKPSIFDTIDKNDIIFAFFPCIRFENEIMLFFRGQAYQQTTWSDEEKMLYDIKLLDEVRHMYRLVNKLFMVCIRGGVSPGGRKPLFGRTLLTSLLVHTTRNHRQGQKIERGLLKETYAVLVRKLSTRTVCLV